MVRIARVISEAHALSIVQDDWKRFLSRTDSFDQMETFRKYEKWDFLYLALKTDFLLTTFNILNFTIKFKEDTIFRYV